MSGRKNGRQSVAALIQDHLDTISRMRDDDALVAHIVACSEEIVRCYRGGGKVLVFGCGGSAADSQHIAAEFINKLNLERGTLPAIALTTDTSVLTAIGNDSGFDQVFSRQVEGLAHEGDVVIGISTSGTSPSVINGLRLAKTRRATTIFLTGQAVQKLPDADYILNIPSGSTARVQEAHITVAHVICDLVERELFDRKHQG